MSQFEDKIVQRKRATRKRRQRVLYEKIGVCKMGSFIYSEQFELNQFFALTDPSDEELARATAVIEEHIARSVAIWKEIMGTLPDDQS